MRALFSDGFLMAMLAAIVLALLAPALGASGGVLRLDTIAPIGVALVFFLHGAQLSPAKLKAGAAHWRLHALVQFSTFVLFPLIGLAAAVALGAYLPRDLLLGFFYLCALPSTVTSSIALTAMARGNIAGAIFNATASSLIGMLLTPLIVSLYLQAADQGGPLLDQFAKIAQQLLLPFALGQLLRPVMADLLAARRKLTSGIDRGVVVLIVYQSFCNATAAGTWTRHGAGALLLSLAMTAGLLALVLFSTRLFARRLGFVVEDEITAVFCGSKKSLAVGAPMAAMIFGSGASLGLIMLPLLVYHQLQLIVCSALARRYAGRGAGPPKQVAAGV